MKQCFKQLQHKNRNSLITGFNIMHQGKPGQKIRCLYKRSDAIVEWCFKCGREKDIPQCRGNSRKCPFSGHFLLISYGLVLFAIKKWKQPVPSWFITLRRWLFHLIKFMAYCSCGLSCLVKQGATVHLWLRCLLHLGCGLKCARLGGL